MSKPSDDEKDDLAIFSSSDEESDNEEEKAQKSTEQTKTPTKPSTDPDLMDIDEPRSKLLSPDMPPNKRLKATIDEEKKKKRILDEESSDLDTDNDDEMNLDMDNEDNGSSTRDDRYIFGTDINVEEVANKMTHFIKEFEENDDDSKYLRILRKMAVNGSRVIDLDLTDVFKFDERLYYQTVDFPQDLIPMYDDLFNRMLENIIQEMEDRMVEENDDDDDEGVDLSSTPHVYLRVRPFNLTESSFKAIRSLNPEDLDHLVSFRGMITRVNEVIPELKSTCFECLTCRAFVYVKVNSGRVREPLRCKCGAKGVPLTHNRSVFEDKQLIKLQETPESIPEGSTPHSILVAAFNNLVDNVKPGDRVTVTGVYKAGATKQSMFKKTLKFLFSNYIDALHFKVENTSGMESESIKNEKLTNLSDEEVELFKFIANRPDNMKILTESLAPNIFGMKFVKRGILCLLFGGTNKQMDNMSIRGDLHCLLIGDPGTSKSQLLLHVNKISPRGIYTSGKGSSSVGLTAYVNKDPSTGEYILESGAMVLSDKGVCCIDEFDKMSHIVRSVLHEVMEQQTVSIAKAGIICSLNARTSILASANPIESKFNDKKSLMYNVNLPPTLLSRFDLIFCIRDNVENDKKLAAHIVDFFKEDEDPDEIEEEGEDDYNFRNVTKLSMAQITKYIEYAKTNFNPILGDGVGETLVKMFLRMRKDSAGKKELNATPRQLESLIRMSESIAKMRFSNIVTQDDVKKAFKIMKRTVYFKQK